MTARGDWIQLHDGSRFYPFDPRAEEITIEAIAHGLAAEPRFGGHTLDGPYVVAQHSVLASEHIDVGDYAPEDRRPLKLAALLHDAPEGLGLKDLPYPVKRNIGPQYRDAEKNMSRVIGAKFLGSRAHLLESLAVKAIDRRMLATERRDLMAPMPDTWTVDGHEIVDPLPIRIVAWGFREAKARFLARFYELSGSRTPDIRVAQEGVAKVLAALNRAVIDDVRMGTLRVVECNDANVTDDEKGAA